MAEIVHFPRERRVGAHVSPSDGSPESEADRYLRAGEILVNLLQQAERTQAAILAYQTETATKKTE
ncbi:hypothetical protein FHT72_005864 [Rhizobium sp. BK077]|uniref:hypothetical protein n=1 Tax=unclassified Rhizobium TaxID=2613769 RepID=UPI0016151FAD|nr:MULTISPECIES: hypothetical protein [unclassified Rhizobium]MBB3302215.1 hypothetical protein [Rhizobium sp. BK112]MBB3371337.1 hypothetical protein [Rhizobium sp. BK077]MBB4182175.1 hypothetical protein [Rhizobium sp. BK109]MBB4255604.1 hypothetical protein [Rhizobium sp. BK008]